MKTKSTHIAQEAAMNLRKMREQLGFSRVKMASLFQVSPSAYYRNENGHTLPSGKSLRLLTEEYDVSMDWLLFSKGPMFYKEKQPGKERGTTPEVRVEVKELPPDIRELTETMERVPLLYHEILAYFQKFKVKHKGLVEAADEEERK